VTPGSIRVGFAILAPLGGSASRERSADAVVTELRAQVALATSPLRSGTGLAAAVDPTAAIKAVVSESVESLGADVAASDSLRDPSSFDFTAVLGPSASEGVTMRWSFVGASTWRAQFEWAADSWASVGVKRELLGNGMADAWGVLFLPGSPDPAGRVIEIDLHNTSLGGVVPQGSQDLSVTRLQRVSSSGSGSGRRVRAVRELAGGTLVWRADVERAVRSRDSRDPALTASTQARFVYALGQTSAEGRGRESMRNHGPRRGSYVVDLGTGAVTDAPLDPLVVAHGSLMFLAWGVLLPAGALIGRFARNVVPVSGPAAFWFRWHWVLQLSGTAASLVGAATAIAMVAQAGGAHFVGLHKAGGLVLVLLGSGLAVAGMLRPGKDSSWRAAWGWGHKGGGSTSLVLGCVVVVSGLLAARAADWVIGLAAAVLVCELLAFVVLSVRGVGRKPPATVAGCQVGPGPKASSGVIKPGPAGSGVDSPSGAAGGGSTHFVSPIHKTTST